MNQNSEKNGSEERDETHSLKYKKYFSKILIDKRILSNDYSIEAFSAYVAIKLLMNGYDKLIYANPTSLVFQLKQTQALDNQNTARLIKKGLEHLDGNFITKTNSKNIYDISNMLNTEYFVYVERDAIRKIFSYDTDVNKLIIMKYYICLLSTLFNTEKGFGGYGFLSIEELSERFNISRSSISKYNPILEQLKLIYIYRSERYQKNIEGSIKKYGKDNEAKLLKRVSNRYGRYEDRDKIILNSKNYDYQHCVLLNKNKKEIWGDGEPDITHYDDNRGNISNF